MVDEQQKIKIVYVVSGLETGGAEHMLYRLVKGLDKSQFLPVILSLGKGGRFAELFKWEGFEVVEGLWPSIKRVLFQESGSVEANEGRLILHGWMYYGCVVAQLLSAFKVRSTPVIWGVRGGYGKQTAQKLLSSCVSKLCKLLSGFPSNIVYNSVCSYEQHSAGGYASANACVIPNGYNPDDYRPDLEAKKRLRNNYNIPADRIVVGVVGRYHPVKGYEVLFKALSLIKEKFPKLHLMMVGKGLDNSNSDLVAFLVKEGIREQVTLIGEQGNVASIMPGFDFYVSSSLSESFPNVLCEAMLCGVLCVATDVGDSKIIVGDTGVIIEPDRPQALADGLSSLLLFSQEKRSEMSVAARNRITNSFGLRLFIDRYQNLYLQLLGRHSVS